LLRGRPWAWFASPITFAGNDNEEPRMTMTSLFFIWRSFAPRSPVFLCYFPVALLLAFPDSSLLFLAAFPGFSRVCHWFLEFFAPLLQEFAGGARPFAETQLLGTGCGDKSIIKLHELERLFASS
jgi:hypothetical protein